jgi:hypothetical protein
MVTGPRIVEAMGVVRAKMQTGEDIYQLLRTAVLSKPSYSGHVWRVLCYQYG